MNNRNFGRDVLFGIAVGDAIGVPYEFKPRAALKESPATDMAGYGSHNQPPGTWSDDSSLTFCLAEMLCGKYDLRDLANRFINWKEYAYWTAHNEVFDIGIATSAAIHNLYKGTSPTLAGGNDEGSNGNGSLMRILPLIFHIKDMPIAKRFEYIKEVSSLTHRHIRAIVSCFIYTEYALQLLKGVDKFEAFSQMQKNANYFLYNEEITDHEINKFHRILENAIGDFEIVPVYKLEEDEVYSSGYVLNTLEAALWCVLTTNNYKDAVLKAVNLGSDTDTTAAVTGGLAALLYGYETIPIEWLIKLAKADDIRNLADRLSTKYCL